MAQSEISFFVDDNSITSRSAEVPDANWSSGLLGGASNSPGIGISTENPGLDESLPNWTLLDQNSNARESQRGQLIGGPGFVDRSSTEWPSSGGEEGTAPDATIRFMPAENLPTAAEKADGSKLDGELSLPAQGANLSDLAVGWAPAPEEEPEP